MTREICSWENEFETRPPPPPPSPTPLCQRTSRLECLGSWDVLVHEVEHVQPSELAREPIFSSTKQYETLTKLERNKLES
jgi:hypothetical protein